MISPEHANDGADSQHTQKWSSHVCPALEEVCIRLRKNHEFLREDASPLRLHTSAQHHVALVVQSNQLGFCFHLSVHTCENNFVLPRIHSHHTVVPKLLGPGKVRGVSLLRFIHDSGGCLCGALVGVDDCNLRVVQVGEDMGFKCHCGAQGIV